MTDAAAEPIKDTVNSAELARVVTDQLMLKIAMGPAAWDRSSERVWERGERKHVSRGVAGSASDGIELPRALVQQWIDNRQIIIRREFHGHETKLRQMHGSPTAFLQKHGLHRPKHDA